MTQAQHPQAHATAFLFVPATRPERIAKALASGAEAVIVDLEDAVAPADKDPARDNLAAALQTLEVPQRERTWVRINPAGTPWHPDDLQAAARWSDLGIAGLVVPKAESADGLLAIVAACGRHMRLLPLVESVAGLEAVDALARSPQVLRLAFGHLDFQVDAGMDCSADESELTSLRLRIVLASRRAGLPPPLDGVTTDIGDAARLAADAERARRLGFGGKLCIHPAQVAGVQSAFKPTPEQLAWARRVLDAAATQGGAFSLDGKMVDGPVIAKAKRIASSAG